jgi:N-acetylmuramoyl-L-alanine amidase
VRRANEIYQTDGRCIYLSIHANAGGRRGWEVFTSKGETRSDRIATVFYDMINEEFPETRMRPDTSDGDPDKEAQFDVLANTKMPAVLTENFFMDNEAECKEYLLSENSRDRIAKAHFNAIVKIEGMDI